MRLATGLRLGWTDGGKSGEKLERAKGQEIPGQFTLTLPVVVGGVVPRKPGLLTG